MSAVWQAAQPNARPRPCSWSPWQSLQFQVRGAANSSPWALADQFGWPPRPVEVWAKRTTTALSALPESWQPALPEQSPANAWYPYPVLPAALNATAVPQGKSAEHAVAAGPQLMPAGDDVTVPSCGRMTVVPLDGSNQ